MVTALNCLISLTVCHVSEFTKTAGLCVFISPSGLVNCRFTCRALGPSQTGSSWFLRYNFMYVVYNYYYSAKVSLFEVVIVQLQDKSVQYMRFMISVLKTFWFG